MSGENSTVRRAEVGDITPNDISNMIAELESVSGLISTIGSNSGGGGGGDTPIAPGLVPVDSNNDRISLAMGKQEMGREDLPGKDIQLSRKQAEIHLLDGHVIIYIARGTNPSYLQRGGQGELIRLSKDSITALMHNDTIFFIEKKYHYRIDNPASVGGGGGGGGSGVDQAKKQLSAIVDQHSSRLSSLHTQLTRLSDDKRELARERNRMDDEKEELRKERATLQKVKKNLKKQQAALQADSRGRRGDSDEEGESFDEPIGRQRTRVLDQLAVLEPRRLAAMVRGQVERVDAFCRAVAKMLPQPASASLAAGGDDDEDEFEYGDARGSENRSERKSKKKKKDKDKDKDKSRERSRNRERERDKGDRDRDRNRDRDRERMDRERAQERGDSRDGRGGMGARPKSKGGSRNGGVGGRGDYATYEEMGGMAPVDYIRQAEGGGGGSKNALPHLVCPDGADSEVENDGVNGGAVSAGRPRPPAGHVTSNTEGRGGMMRQQQQQQKQAPAGEDSGGMVRSETLRMLASDATVGMLHANVSVQQLMDSGAIRQGPQGAPKGRDAGWESAASVSSEGDYEASDDEV